MELTGYIARETDKAIAFILREDAQNGVKPLWIPRAKLDAMEELDELSKTITLAGEGVARICTPVYIDVDNLFLKKIGIA